MLVAIRAEHVIIGTVLVVVLETVIRPRYPLGQLSPLEFIQLVADLACILRIRDEEKKDVVKKVVGDEQRDGDRRPHYEHRRDIQELLLCAFEAAFSIQPVYA